MSYELYWYGEAETYWAYHIAYINKIKEKNEFENNISWLQGLYIYQAFSVVEYNINKKPSQEPENYLEKPIDFEEIKQNQKRENRQNNLENRMKALLESKKILLDKRKKVK